MLLERASSSIEKLMALFLWEHMLIMFIFVYLLSEKAKPKLSEIDQSQEHGKKRVGAPDSAIIFFWGQ